MDARGPTTTRRDPGSFRCLVCRDYVHGTEAGHCPRCGYVPPSAPIAADPPAPMRGLTVLVSLLAVAALVVWILTR